MLLISFSKTSFTPQKPYLDPNYKKLHVESPRTPSVVSFKTQPLKPLNQYNGVLGGSGADLLTSQNLDPSTWFQGGMDMKRSQSGDRLDKRSRDVENLPKVKIAAGVSLEDFHPTSRNSGRRFVSNARLDKKMKDEKAKQASDGVTGNNKNINQFKPKSSLKNFSNIPERPRSKYPPSQGVQKAFAPKKDFLNYSVDTATAKLQQQQKQMQQQALNMREISEEEISKMLSQNRGPLVFHKVPHGASPGCHSSVPPNFKHNTTFHLAPQTNVFTVELPKERVELPPLNLPNSKIDTSFYTFNSPPLDPDDHFELINDKRRLTAAISPPKKKFKTVFEAPDSSIEKSEDSADVFCKLPTLPGSSKRPSSFMTALDSSDEVARNESRNRRTSRAHQIFTSLLPHVERDDDDENDGNSQTKLKSFEIPV